jgi:hypothetical protein
MRCACLVEEESPHTAHAAASHFVASRSTSLQNAYGRIRNALTSLSFHSIELCVPVARRWVILFRYSYEPGRLRISRVLMPARTLLCKLAIIITLYAHTCCHSQRVSGQCAGLIHGSSRSHQRHDIYPSTICTNRQATTDNLKNRAEKFTAAEIVCDHIRRHLSEGSYVRGNSVVLLCTAIRNSESGHNL